MERADRARASKRLFTLYGSPNTVRWCRCDKIYSYTFMLDGVLLKWNCVCAHVRTDDNQYKVYCCGIGSCWHKCDVPFEMLPYRNAFGLDCAWKMYCLPTSSIPPDYFRFDSEPISRGELVAPSPPTSLHCSRVHVPTEEEIN